MTITEEELKAASELIVLSERQTGRRLSEGQMVELLADNRCDEKHNWSLEKCREVIKRVIDSWGAGAFHLAEARKLNEIPIPDAAKAFQDEVIALGDRLAKMVADGCSDQERIDVANREMRRIMGMPEPDAMTAALIADGHKLRQMTGQEHGPFCPRCLVNPIDLALLGSDDEGNICGECWNKDRENDDRK